MKTEIESNRILFTFTHSFMSHTLMFNTSGLLAIVATVTVTLTMSEAGKSETFWKKGTRNKT